MKIITKMIVLIGVLSCMFGAGMSAGSVLRVLDEHSEDPEPGISYTRPFLLDMIEKAYHAQLKICSGNLYAQPDAVLEKFLKVKAYSSDEIARLQVIRGYQSKEQLAAAIYENNLDRAYKEIVDNALVEARAAVVEARAAGPDGEEDETQMTSLVDRKKREVEALLARHIQPAVEAETERREQVRMAPEAVARRAEHAAADQDRLKGNKEAFNEFLATVPKADQAQILDRVRKAYPQLYVDDIYNLNSVVEKGHEAVAALAAEREEAARLAREAAAREAAARAALAVEREEAARLAREEAARAALEAARQEAAAAEIENQRRAAEDAVLLQNSSRAEQEALNQKIAQRKAQEEEKRRKLEEVVSAAMREAAEARERNRVAEEAKSKAKASQATQALTNYTPLYTLGLTALGVAALLGTNFAIEYSTWNQLKLNGETDLTFWQYLEKHFPDWNRKKKRNLLKWGALAVALVGAGCSLHQVTR